MKRKDFFVKCGSCGALSVLGLLGFENSSGSENKYGTGVTESEKINKVQITELLKFIDLSVNEKDKKRIYAEFGKQCLYSRNYDKWVIGFKNNIDEFFERVQRGEATYWEKLEYDKNKSVITLIGKKTGSCACGYADCENPPKSLCNYCCKKFQEEMFGLLLDKKADVRIDESILLGGERCTTTIFINPG